MNNNSFCSTRNTGNSNNGLDIVSFAMWFYVQELGVEQAIYSRGDLATDNIKFEVRSTVGNTISVV